MLSRALGIAPEVEPHCFERTLARGDVALLCTDGVSNVLDAGALGAKLGTAPPPAPSSPPRASSPRRRRATT